MCRQGLGAAGVGSVRRHQKLPPHQAQLVPASLKMNPALPKAGPISQAVPQPSTAADHSSLCTFQLKAALFSKLLAVSITLFSDTQQLETQKDSRVAGITWRPLIIKFLRVGEEDALFIICSTSVVFLIMWWKQNRSSSSRSSSGAECWLKSLHISQD